MFYLSLSQQDDWMKEMAAGLFEEQEWEEEEEEGDKVKEEAKDEDEATTITGINPPVRRDNEKTEKERRKQKLKKDEVTHFSSFYNNCQVQLQRSNQLHYYNCVGLTVYSKLLIIWHLCCRTCMFCLQLIKCMKALFIGFYFELKFDFNIKHYN